MARTAVSAMQLDNKKNRIANEVLEQRQAWEKQLGGVGAIAPTEELSPREQECFNQLSSMLSSMGTIAHNDCFMITEVAKTLDLIRQCDDELDLNGIFDEGNGLIALKMRTKLHDQYVKGLSILGLTPQARAKQAKDLAESKEKAKLEETDPLMALLAGKSFEHLIPSTK